ncbi:hypothetical protein MNV49_006770 [Pseudohyphozyma bogoriensis]|nr:hypothetical protein MNV49_006770 [Pseudohyphozyma bogoriensis]
MASTSSKVGELSNEVLDQIFSYTDTATLVAASLVSKGWSHVAQARLHRNVQLATKDQAEKWASVAKPVPARTVEVDSRVGEDLVKRVLERAKKCGARITVHLNLELDLEYDDVDELTSLVKTLTTSPDDVAINLRFMIGSDPKSPLLELLTPLAPRVKSMTLFMESMDASKPHPSPADFVSFLRACTNLEEYKDLYDMTPEIISSIPPSVTLLGHGAEAWETHTTYDDTKLLEPLFAKNQLKEIRLLTDESGDWFSGVEEQCEELGVAFTISDAYWRDTVFDESTPLQLTDAQLEETDQQYLIAWSGVDPKTGQSWSPTWEPKSHASKELVALWRQGAAIYAREQHQALHPSSASSSDLSDCISESEQDDVEPANSQLPSPGPSPDPVPTPALAPPALANERSKEEHQKNIKFPLSREILDHAFSHATRATLLAASLVCKQWSHVARSRLYRHVQLPSKRATRSWVESEALEKFPTRLVEVDARVGDQLLRKVSETASKRCGGAKVARHINIEAAGGEGLQEQTIDALIVYLQQNPDTIVHVRFDTTSELVNPFSPSIPPLGSLTLWMDTNDHDVSDPPPDPDSFDQLLKAWTNASPAKPSPAGDRPRGVRFISSGDGKEWRSFERRCEEFGISLSVL